MPTAPLTDLAFAVDRLALLAADLARDPSRSTLAAYASAQAQVAQQTEEVLELLHVERAELENEEPARP
jgi:hypothetical protein